MMKKLSRRDFLQATGAASLAVAGLGCVSPLERLGHWAARPARRPNFIVFITDDQANGELGCNGNPLIKTPNLDTLARQGVLFENNFCTTSICCCSRASIFSGRHTRAHGINSFTQNFSPEVLAQTYPVQLRQAGYRTGLLGKWGIGAQPPVEAFDFWRGHDAEHERYEQEFQGRPVHQTELMTRQTTEFLQGCAPDQPFCLTICYKAPHAQPETPQRMFPPEADLDGLYSDITIPHSPTANEEAFQKLPPFVREKSAGHQWWRGRFDTPEIFQKNARDIYRLITGVDRSIGQIREELTRRQLAGNTVLIFTSDNGYFLGERGLCDKWLMYEESIRTPLIIHDPRLAVTRRGRRVKPMSLNIDLAPTILDYAGVAKPSGMQGENLRPLLAGRPVHWRKDWFYEHTLVYPGLYLPQTSGVRGERWKYTRYVDVDPVYEELFDLETDPHELNNLAASGGQQAVLQAMRKRWVELGKMAERK